MHVPSYMRKWTHFNSSSYKLRNRIELGIFELVQVSSFFDFGLVGTYIDSCWVELLSQILILPPLIGRSIISIFMKSSLKLNNFSVMWSWRNKISSHWTATYWVNCTGEQSVWKVTQYYHLTWFFKKKNVRYLCAIIKWPKL